jgi:uncharacterized protein
MSRDLPDLPDLSPLAVPGAVLAVRASPGARRNAVESGDPLRVFVTAPPADGAANDAIRRLLARALGVAPTRLTLTQGAAARDKRFRLD